ncbi:MAG: hypothetical protein KW806_00970 [Candidatus Yanofskybacteria bacterium]|nr:hypothetical protein [Candidatus Yanofskybacteria bacterium]
MSYNIHPIFVHFPIAFLFVYSIVKILPLQKWLPRISWKQIERTLLVIGTLGALVANQTGEIAEHLLEVDHQIVEMHSFFASLTIFLFGILLIGEIIQVLNKDYISQWKLDRRIKSFSIIIEKLICNKLISILLILMGLITLTLTGLLGGILVYGTTADPFAEIVLRLLKLQ